MKVITFFNNKGGVGKTTLTTNVASYLAENKKKRVLVLDADPQANTTQMVIEPDLWKDFYGENAYRETAQKLFEPLIMDGEPRIDPIVDYFKSEEGNFGFDLIPGDPDLSFVEDRLSEAWSGSTKGDVSGFRTTNWLNTLIYQIRQDYDFLIIDVGPSLGALNRSILLNSRYFITPMGSDIFSLMGIQNMSKWITEWQNSYRRGLEIWQGQNKNTVRLIQRHKITKDINNSTHLVGYSVQQYNSRKFKTGKRPVRAYDEIIAQIYPTIIEWMSPFIDEKIKNEHALHLGDIPYLNSIIPLAQSNNYPLYKLTSSEGVRGSQGSSVVEYKEMLDRIVSQLLRNVGDLVD